MRGFAERVLVKAIVVHFMGTELGILQIWQLLNYRRC